LACRLEVEISQAEDEAEDVLAEGIFSTSQDHISQSIQNTLTE
jgi:hypothetical protein